MDAAADFYAGVFGWTSEAAGGGSEETQNYTFFLLDGKRVVGYGPPGPGEPPSWRAHVAVESADETAAKVADAGGRTLLEPMDIMDVGRIAVFTDPAGAVFCIWQPGAHEGAQAIREPNTLGWCECLTRDTDRAKDFYGSVFGWRADELGGGYSIWTLGDTEVGGLSDMQRMPAEAPPHWQIHFAVEDVDAVATRVPELGGNVVVPPTTIQVAERGELRFSVCGDPNGATFGVFAG
jgi:predicted enzyme related to lactoylglutathione lyase